MRRVTLSGRDLVKDIFMQNYIYGNNLPEIIAQARDFSKKHKGNWSFAYKGCTLNFQDGAIVFKYFNNPNHKMYYRSLSVWVVKGTRKFTM